MILTGEGEERGVPVGQRETPLAHSTGDGNDIRPGGWGGVRLLDTRERETGWWEEKREWRGQGVPSKALSASANSISARMSRGQRPSRKRTHVALYTNI